VKIGKDRVAGAGRSAVSLSRDSDYEDCINGIWGLPKRARDWGPVAAVTWAQVELRSAIDLVDLAPESPFHTQVVAVVDEWFKSGPLYVATRPDQVGWAARARISRWVEVLLRMTIRENFVRSPPDVEKRMMGGTEDRGER
jgi:hypothetical protein